MSNNSSLYTNLREKLEEISLIDTHNHLPKEEDWVNDKEEDFTSLLGYAEGKI